MRHEVSSNFFLALLFLDEAETQQSALTPLLPQRLIHYSGKIKLFTIICDIMSACEIKVT